MKLFPIFRLLAISCYWVLALGCDASIDTEHSEKSPEPIDYSHLPNVGYITQESYVQAWVDQLTSLIKTRPEYIVDREEVPNRHDATITDTIFHWDHAGNQSWVYHVTASDQHILMKAELTTSQLMLFQGLTAGLSRAEIMDFLGMEFGNDTLQIGNLEHNLVFNLLLESDTAQLITYEGHVD
ncbi:hypothetical protein [Pontibacter sp. G13]|uniref:hypothetical protein n=1 Tax=Pontibacter sp. G13 TaxID=3074898 RepID=UPI00288BEA16|nr:hypothetical protein [Pontibacter sp. G13]WNJ18369.1 hypothetical protein RJD25_26240 [Pontibacter sp. G13]